MKNEILSKCYVKAVEAYMGGQGFEGSNSKVPCSELAPKIREILKACGIKGVTVSKKWAGYTPEITVKFRLQDGDIREYEEIREQVEDANFIGVCRTNWMVDPKNPAEYIRSKNFFEMSGEEQRNALSFWGRRWYESAKVGDFGSITRGSQINKESYPIFTEKFFDRWNAVSRIVQSFNYDKSESVVDYFDVNFYERYEIIAA